MNRNEVNILNLSDQIFNEEKCYALAKKTKFIVRSSSKIKGHEFLKILILPSEGSTRDSLTGLCDRMRI